MATNVVLIGQNVSNVETEIKKKIAGYFGTKNYFPSIGNQFIINSPLEASDRRYIESCLPQGIKAIYISNGETTTK